jgi:hypothetical protein
VRLSLGLSIACACLAVAPRGAAADDDAGVPRALMTCEPADGPGRVRCEVEATILPGASITWGDVVLTRMPPFASALRGRIGPGEAMVSRSDSWRWALALVARSKGVGDVEGRVRLVVCRGTGEGKGVPDAGATAGTCAPYDLPVAGRVSIGP